MESDKPTIRYRAQGFTCVMKQPPPGTKSRARLPRGMEEHVPEILVDILALAMPRIRAASAKGDATRCGIEADHVQGLPSVLAEWNRERVDHYWNVERSEFIKQTSAADLREFEPLWRELEEHLTWEAKATATS